MSRYGKNEWAALTYADGTADGSLPSEYERQPGSRNRLAAILGLLRGAGLAGDARILEVGCGSGNVAMAMAACGYRVTAIDVHGPSIETARQRNPFPHCTFECMPVEEMDLAVYDALVMTEVLEHVPECGKLLDYLAKASRADAWLILTVPNGGSVLELLCRPSYMLKRFSWGIRLVQAIKRFLGTRDLTTCDPGTPHVHFFRRRTLLKLFVHAGYRVVRWHKMFWLWPVWEIFFLDRRHPVDWPRKDFARSQHLPAAFCTWWAFCLRKESGARQT